MRDSHRLVISSICFSLQSLSINFLTLLEVSTTIGVSKGL